MRREETKGRKEEGSFGREGEKSGGGGSGPYRLIRQRGIIAFCLLEEEEEGK